MVIDLKESARQWVLQNLPYDRQDKELSNYINSLNAHGLLVSYHNWITRLVPKQPRQVVVSKTLLQSSHYSDHNYVIETIITDIKMGIDLNKYLSRAVNIAIQKPSRNRFNHRKDLDLMLNSWGIHHLHLSTKIEKDQFVKRSKHLLFVFFTEHTAYLIDIMRHGDWASEHILRVLKNELAEAKAVYVVNGVTGLARDVSDNDNKYLRSAGVETMRVIDGDVIMGAKGISTAGTSIDSTREADQILDDLDFFEKSWQTNREKFHIAAGIAGKVFPKKPDFQFIIHHKLGMGVLEKKEKLFFPL